MKMALHPAMERPFGLKIATGLMPAHSVCSVRPMMSSWVAFESTLKKAL